MFKLSFRTGIFTALAAALTAFAPAPADAEPIILYGNAAQAPKSWLDGTTPKGYAIEISEAILKKAGYDVEIRLVPFQRGLEEAKTNGVMTGIFHSPDRDAAYEFSESIGDDKVLLVTQKGKPFQYKSASDLIPQKIGALLGGFYGPEWNSVKPQLKLDEDNDPGLRMKKLVAGRFDVGVFSPGKIAVNEALKKSGVPESEIEIQPTPLAVLSNHMVVGKGRPDSKQFIERINKAIAAINADGTIPKIMAKYEN
ncbi:MAG TPA: transporter substrate-binding domain-containing protein [Azospirillaceae bacterium]|nr:transporter substrate-binding domain-containing protein [Azospirillaceae bacterium]